jgi:hypothetical protein
MSMMLLLSYVAVLSSIYNAINVQPWGNPRLAKSLIGLLVTISYIVGYIKWLWMFRAATLWHWMVVDYATWMSAYFLVDSSLLLQFQHEDAYNFIVHHIVSIKLIQAHVENVFSISSGMHYLAIFELSNLFMQMFQMSHWQGWERAKRVLVYPFVATYVPLRLIAIPYYSIAHYAPSIFRMKIGGMMYYGMMMMFINAFSIFYALVVANKFHRHIRR